ncbi:hypothetical protein [Verminephrobacter eiseniae]|nr:hypothetical protein [Verminephrobacter eiseniae]
MKDSRFLWNGQIDHDSAGDTRRLHQLVQPCDHNTRSALIGFACDEGV